MPNFDSYIFFNGQCAEAMRFYERTLGGKIETLMTYADAPPSEQQQCPAPSDHVMHARLVVEGRALMASDQPPGAPAQAMAGFALSLQYASADEARRIFDRLSEGGKVQMPLAKTFFADTFGMLVDRFGTPWMVGGGFQAV
jgi:PhnB protein